MKFRKILCFISVFMVVVSALSAWLAVRWAMPDRAGYDSILVRDTVWLDSPTLTSVRVVEIPSRVDTAEIIREYYKQKVYVDTIRPNEFVTVVVHDTVSLNSLDSQGLQVYTRIPEFKEKKNSLLFRMDGGMNICHVGAEYRHKDIGVFVGYDFLGRTPVVGLNYRVKTW